MRAETRESLVMHALVWMAVSLLMVLYFAQAHRRMLDMDRVVTHQDVALKEQSRKLKVAEAKIEELKAQDAATGLSSREHFELSLERRLSHVAFAGAGAALMPVEVDDFVAYNDAYGAIEGDALLYAVAKILKRELVSYKPLIGRFAVGSFAVLLTEVEQDRAVEVAEHLAALIVEEKIAFDVHETGDFVSCSIGLTYIHPGVTARSSVMFNAAMRAVVRARHLGRGRVFMQA